LEQKIAVLGTGANGSSAAADLTKAGYDVHLIDQWPEHVEVMRRVGVKISMPDEELCVPVEAYHLCDLASMTCKYDVVFLFTKSYDTRWACELIKPYLHREGLLVGVQNAMTVDDIVEIVGEERTLGCVIELSSEIFTPGLVKRNTPHSKTWFGVGNINPKRNFNYIKDTVSGFERACKSNCFNGQVINIGGKFEISIKDTIKLISRLMDKKLKIKSDLKRKRPKKSEVYRLVASNVKAKKLLKWKPAYDNKVSFTNAIQETITWYSDPENLEKFKSNLYNL